MLSTLPQEALRVDNGISLDWRCLLVRAEAVLMVFVHCAGGLVGIKLIVMSKLNLFVHGIGSSGKERVFVGIQAALNLAEELRVPKLTAESTWNFEM
ncbi:hypothetical protein WN943_008928 [Citrus x changshan-huyou]